VTRREPQGHPDPSTSSGSPRAESRGEHGRGVKALYGLYPDGHSAQQAIGRLHAAGVSDRQIIIQSAQPMEDFEFGHRDKATWMWWIACGGALVGLASALGLSWLTETSWPIDVGGLPIFAWWPNLIIAFELTMLGAIVATVITLAITARLGRRSTIYDPEVADGKILVGVANPPASTLADLEAALATPASAQLKKIE
jgi:hypothetical protein